jgi:hypothetical protein
MLYTEESRWSTLRPDVVVRERFIYFLNEITVPVIRIGLFKDPVPETWRFGGRVHLLVNSVAGIDTVAGSWNIPLNYYQLIEVDPRWIPYLLRLDIHHWIDNADLRSQLYT